MRFDDRLATILTSRVGDAHDRVIRWRQLVDLVSRAGRGAQGPALDEAMKVIGAGRDEVPEEARAAAARAIAGRDLPAALLEAFASDTVKVAAPLLAGAEQNEQVRAAASPEVRRFLAAMDPGLVTTEETAVPVLSPSAPVAAATPAGVVPSIGEVVARIEQLRALRAGAEHEPVGPEEQMPVEQPEPEQVGPPLNEGSPSPASVTRVPPAETEPPTSGDRSPPLFRWECGPGGEIDWIEGAPRGALIGRSIAHASASESLHPAVETAFARRSPFQDGVLELGGEGIGSGTWLISGMPSFAAEDGRFVGYRGIARRSVETGQTPASPIPLDEAALRELVHEIRTPLNAIIGFAELIDGQYLGPAPSGYRTRATEIVQQARDLLEAVEDLDFVARRKGQPVGATDDAAAVFEKVARFLQDQAQSRGVRLLIDPLPDGLSCGVETELAERLMRRFANALLSEAQPGEAIHLRLEATSGGCTLHVSRPRSLRGIELNYLLGSEGKGSSLKLAAGLARIVHGSVEDQSGELVLRIPTGG